MEESHAEKAGGFVVPEPSPMHPHHHLFPALPATVRAFLWASFKEGST